MRVSAGFQLASFSRFYFVSFEVPNRIFNIIMASDVDTQKIRRNTVKFESLDATIQKVLHEAVNARAYAYCPYSKFQVGACLLCEDGSIYRGCNVENSAFTVGICAERTAYAKAISEGKMKFRAIAVIGYQENSFTTPCGACRQFLSEFGPVDVYLSKPKLEEVLVTNLDELLPNAFQHNTDYSF